ncbi:hypothetical protein PAEPH01_0455 [Pancytospora epiphaga]|nr:hypothetical protein PAEPH01_0455 [Pancytospora epiphaga]
MTADDKKLPSIRLHASEDENAVDPGVEKMMDLIQTNINVVTESPQSFVQKENVSKPKRRHVRQPKPKTLSKREGSDTMRNDSRQKVSWSPEELKVLLDGVKLYGEGNWARILYDNLDSFHTERRVIDLVNKYKQYYKLSSFYTSIKREWTCIGEDGEPRLKDQLNQPMFFFEKFPYTVATKVAKRLRLKNGQITRIIVKLMKNARAVHHYRAGIYDGKLLVKKIVPTL